LDRIIVTNALDRLGKNNLLFHAGVVAQGGRGVLLAAPSGSGKTTLVGGLLQAGFNYLTDEIAVLDTQTGRALPFARSLCLKPGTRELLMQHFPRLKNARKYFNFGREPVVFLTPRKIEWATQPVHVVGVIFPQFIRGAGTTLEKIPRSEALELLLNQAFNLRSHGAEGLAQAVELLRKARCYKLTVGTLGSAVQLLLSEFGDTFTNLEREQSHF